MHVAAATCAGPLTALLAPPSPRAHAAHEGEGDAEASVSWRWVAPALLHATLGVLLPAIVGYTPFIV